MTPEEKRRRQMDALSDEQFEQLMKLATMPPEDFRVIERIPRNAAFWLGAAAAVSTIAGAVWAVVSMAPERAADAARAAVEHHGP